MADVQYCLIVILNINRDAKLSKKVIKMFISYAEFLKKLIDMCNNNNSTIIITQIHDRKNLYFKIELQTYAHETMIEADLIQLDCLNDNNLSSTLYNILNKFLPHIKNIINTTDSKSVDRILSKFYLELTNLLQTVSPSLSS